MNIIVLAIALVLSVLAFIFKIRSYKKETNAKKVLERTVIAVKATPRNPICSETQAYNGLKASYACNKEDIVFSQSGNDLTKFTDKQIYLIKSLFARYADKRLKVKSGRVELLATNHAAETYALYCESQSNIANHLNEIFGTCKSLSTYKRLISDKT